MHNDRRDLACFGKNISVSEKICDIKKRVAALPDTEQISGTSQFKILLGYLETVIAPVQDIKPPAYILALLTGHENGIGLGVTAAYPAPQLMKGGKSEALRVFYHYDSRVRNIHSHFHNSCRYQYLY